MIKSKLTLSTLCAGALMLGAVGLRAETGHDHSKDGKHEPSKHDHAAAAPAGGSMSSHDGMTSLYNHLGEMEKELAAGKLDGLHGHDEAIQALAKTLAKDTALSADRKKRVHGYVRNVARLSGKLHASADGNDLEKAKKDFPKLQAQVDLLAKQFSHSHKPGISATPKEGGEHQHGNKTHHHPHDK